MDTAPRREDTTVADETGTESGQAAHPHVPPAPEEATPSGQQASGDAGPVAGSSDGAGPWKAPAHGLFMGLADAVPGVSGGTIAFLLGIHRRLVGAIAALDAALLKDIFGAEGDARQAWRRADLGFLALLAIGIATGLVTGAVVLSDALTRWPEVLMAVILGLVVASIRSPARWVRWDWRAGAMAAAVAAPAFIITVLEPVQAPTALWFLPLAGAIAACAMILPGISGAYLLLLMGLYAHVIDAVAHARLGIVALVGLGAVVGLLLFSRGLRWLLDEHTSLTHAAMVGLLVGSLGRLWPWRTRPGFAEGDPAAPVGVGLWAFIALGAVAGYLLDRRPRTKEG